MRHLFLRIFEKTYIGIFLEKMLGKQLHKNSKYENFFTEAKNFEDKYEWIKAASVYEKFLDYLSKSKVPFDTAEILEKMGFAFYQAAKQSRKAEEFNERIKLAINAYQKAESMLKTRKPTEYFFCRSMHLYLKSKITMDYTEKRKLIYESYNFMFRALKHPEIEENLLKLGKIHNMFLKLIIKIIDSENNWRKRKELIEKAIAISDEIIKLLAKTNFAEVLTEAYSLLSQIYTRCYGCYELDDNRVNYIQKCIEYAQKALETSKIIEDSYAKCLAGITAAWAFYGFKGDLEKALKFGEKALKEGLKTKDNALIGDAYFILAEIIYWKTLTEESFDLVKKYHDKVIEYSQKAITHSRIVSEELTITNGFFRITESYSYLAKNIETSIKKKQQLLEKAVENGLEGLKIAKNSGIPDTTQLLAHALSKAFQQLSIIEKNLNNKVKFLEKASTFRQEAIQIVHEVFPFMYWEQGVYQNYQALIIAESANIEQDEEKKRRLLEMAVSHAEKCLELCQKSIKFYKQKGYYSALARYSDNAGQIFSKLYNITKDKKIAEKAITAYQNSIEIYKKLNMPTRVAEITWLIGRIKSQIGEHLKAAEYFEEAAKQYGIAAEKMPNFKDFYGEYKRYMQAWSYIEKAKHEHINRKYTSAALFYKKAAKIHNSLKRFAYLTQNYLAWYQLEKAEDLSRKGEDEKAVKKFKEAIITFKDSINRLKYALDEIKSPYEKDLIMKLINASRLRQEYCEGRISLEEARMEFAFGHYLQSSKKYGLAANIFQKVLEKLETDYEREELLPLFYFCRAWEKMMLALWKLSSELFNEASKLFEKAKEHSKDDATILFALGNSILCKALEAMTEYEAKRNIETYQLAKQLLESATTYYLRAGMSETSFWTEATEYLLDAYFFLTKAEAEIEFDEKIRLYKLAEKNFERSAELFEKAGHLAKKREVENIMNIVKERHEFALSLVKVLEAPLNASSVELLSTPTPTYEKAIGTEEFESASLCSSITMPVDVNVGEEFEMIIDLINVGKGTGILLRISRLVPSGFEITKIPSEYTLEGESLNVKGKRLLPLKSESIKISLKALKSGSFDISPKIHYVDEKGTLKYCSPEAVTLKVHSPTEFKFKREETKLVFHYLISSFIKDYMKHKLSLENSGWRSRVEISKEAKVPWSSVYGSAGRLGYAVAELARRGLIETKFFKGEPGRGGKILKIRISYDREIIKRYVDSYIMKKGIHN